MIGVDRYEHLPKNAQLKVAVSDAAKLADTLRELDPPFKVDLLRNVRQRDAMEALTRFIDSASGAECALIYFAGHGIEYYGTNFLLASDTRISQASPDVERMKRRLRLTSLPLQAFVDELDGTRAQVKVVILDACRDNPLTLEEPSGTRSVFGGTRGLASVTPPSGTLIAYSADVGQQANDGLFTDILTRNLKRKGLSLPLVFAATREEVKSASLELAEAKRGVFHEPAEYTKLNVAGMKFLFNQGETEEERIRRESEARVAALEKQISTLQETISQQEKDGAEMAKLKELLAEMEENREKAEKVVSSPDPPSEPLEERPAVADKTSWASKFLAWMNPFSGAGDHASSKSDSLVESGDEKEEAELSPEPASKLDVAAVDPNTSFPADPKEKGNGASAMEEIDNPAPKPQKDADPPTDFSDLPTKGIRSANPDRVRLNEAWGHLRELERDSESHNGRGFNREDAIDKAESIFREIREQGHEDSKEETEDGLAEVAAKKALLKNPVYGIRLGDSLGEDPDDHKEDVGWINGKGEVVIEPVWGSNLGGLGSIQFFSATYEVSRGGKSGYIDYTGKLIIEPIYDDTYWLREGRAFVEKEGKWGVINRKGEWISSPQWKNGSHYEGGVAMVENEQGLGLIDRSGKLVISPDPRWDPYRPFKLLNNGTIRVQSGKKFGLFDRTGRMLVAPRWLSLKDFSEGLAAVVDENEKWGFINAEGDIVIEPSWDRVSDFSLGFARVDRDYKSGIINAAGEIAIEPGKASLFAPHRIDSDSERKEHFPNYLTSFKKGRKFGVMNQHKEVVIPPQWEGIDNLSPYQLYINVKRDGKEGLIDRTGRVIVEPVWDKCEWLSREEKLEHDPTKESPVFFVAVENPGVSYGYSHRTPPGRKDDEPLKSIQKWGVLDATGKQLVEPKWTYIQFDPDTSGFIVGTLTDEYNPSAKLGFLNASGEMIVDAKWDEIRTVGGRILAGTRTVLDGIVWAVYDQKGTFLGNLPHVAGKDRRDFDFEISEWLGDLAFLPKEGKWAIINLSQISSKEPEYRFDRISRYKYGSLVMVTEEKKNGRDRMAWINGKGEIVWQNKWFESHQERAEEG